MKVYVIVSITAEGKVLTNFSVEPVGVCSTIEKALEFVNELEAERICPTYHSAELNQIFFETIEHMDCYFDPMSIYR